MVAVERERPLPVAPPAGGDAIPLKLRRIGSTPRQVLAMAVIGTLVLGVFASRDLSSWLDRMGGGWGLVPLQHAAAEWDDAMTRLGLTAPFVLLRDTVQRLRDAQWPAGRDRTATIGKTGPAGLRRVAGLR
ncbi:MAG TPA: hypothetical protein VFX06_15225 [Stellaceae bacterium]|jgi:hypothetical protein|nr:hypothetical protein [Stellaceae bacterium]